MYLTGSDARHVGTYALIIIETLLETRLTQAPWQATFAPWNGLPVISDPVKALGFARSKRPFIFLEVADIHPDPALNFRKIVDAVLRDGTRWLIEISAEVVTTDACAPAEPKAKAALLSIIDSSYAYLRDLGLEGCDARAGQGRDQNPSRINPHTISCAIHALND